MKRPSLIAAAALIAVSATAVVATAHDRGGPQGFGGLGLFERLDTDGNGEITRAEAESAAAARFAAADANGDGMLSAEELTAAAEERRADRAARGIERMIERQDANDDGQLSLEEMTARRDGDRLDRLFDRIDADGDGTITKAEADEALADMGNRRHGRGHERGHGRGRN